MLTVRIDPDQTTEDEGVAVIEFDAVTKAYPDGTVAVDGLGLRIPEQAITVLVGPSGCGKTTTLRMVNRMIDPTSGRITVDGEDIAGKDPAVLRRGMGYVIQHAGLFPHRTIVDNVATVPVLNGAKKAEARAAAYDLLERVGLEREMGDRYPTQLSGGQQQRVGVARALAADPPILLMDEPFSAVDPIVRGELQEELLRLQAELGKTIVLVTHDIDEAIRLGDRIAVMAVGGRLAQYAPPEEILTRPADEFVERFVGVDRGFRSLSFVPSSAVPLRPVDAPHGERRLHVDDAGRPTGWSRDDGDDLPLVGTYGPEHTARAVADLLMRSRTGTAVAVDAEGRATGYVTQDDLSSMLRDRANRWGT